jgi:hypothetical protein
MCYHSRVAEDNETHTLKSWERRFREGLDLRLHSGIRTALGGGKWASKLHRDRRGQARLGGRLCHHLSYRLLQRTPDPGRARKDPSQRVIGMVAIGDEDK